VFSIEGDKNMSKWVKRAAVSSILAASVFAMPGTALAASDPCPNGTVNSTEGGLLSGTGLNGTVHSTTNTVC
jgi:hypothetical protein